MSSGSRKSVVIVAVVALAVACRQQMADQPRYDPLEPGPFFADGRGSRDRVPGTVARGELELIEDEHMRTGRVGTRPADVWPMAVTRAVVERGRERYEIFCAPCHDAAGHGDGMVVRRGFRRPGSLHVERLRLAPAGYLVDVMADGFGAMSGFAAQLPPRDRWAVAAYVRALQLSQHVPAADLSPDDRRQLEKKP